jgi:hypothetical protein
MAAAKGVAMAFCRRTRQVAFLFLIGVLALRGAPALSGERGSWQVVLAAGDDAQPVFDNATQAMRRLLVEEGVSPAKIRRLSAVAGTAEPASAGRLLGEIAALPAGPGDRCLVFLTSHGKEGAGLWLAASQATLPPEPLANALSQGCRQVPTVVIVSGCYTGAFAGGRMAAPNRIILTAARADRPSFGCQADRQYNFFDECLLAALPRELTWRAVSGDVGNCVRRKEHQLAMPPSEPRAYFGPAVADLSVRY